MYGVVRIEPATHDISDNDGSSCRRYFVGRQCRAVCQGCQYRRPTLSVVKMTARDNDRSCVVALVNELRCRKAGRVFCCVDGAWSDTACLPFVNDVNLGLTLRI